MSTAALAILVLLAAPGGDPAFESIVAGLANRSHAESCAQMEAWLAANPTSPDVPRGLLWAARVRLMDGREDLARPLVERARDEGAGTRWENAAKKELADLDVGARRYFRAAATFDQLAASPEPYWSTLGKLSAASARSEGYRWLGFLVVFNALVLLVVLRFALARKRGAPVLPVPLEVGIGAPLALALVLVSLGKQPAQVHAVLWMAIGGVVLLWANAISLRGTTLTTGQRLRAAALGASQGLTLAYCALVANGLWSKLLATLRLGGG